MTEEIDLSKRLQGAVADTMAHLEAQLEVVKVRLGKLSEGGFDPELARAGAGLARAIKEVAGEWRQLEKHDRKMVVTPEQRFAALLKYIRTLDPLQRKELRRELTVLERERAA